MAILAPLMLMACQWKGEAAAPAAERVAEGDRMWRPEPISLRVSDSSRFAEEQGELSLETRVEAVDDMGDLAKMAGSVLLEVYRAEGAPAGSIGKRLYRWEVQLRTLEDQRMHYDSVLRAYLFHLKVQNLPDLEYVHLRVTLNRLGRPRLTDETMLAVVVKRHP